MRIFRVNYECWAGKKPEDEGEQNQVFVVAPTMEEAVRKADKHMKVEWKGVYGCMKPLECTLEHDIEVI